MENTHISQFIRSSIKWGKISGFLGCFILFIPCVLMMAIGITPIWSAVWAGSLSQISISGIYFIIEPLSYFTALGIPGTYMSFLSGNVCNMRIPCAIVAQEAVHEPIGSERGQIFSTIGIAVSIFVGITILAVFCFGGNALIQIMPPQISKSFNYVLPAIFSAILANAVIANPKCASVGIPLAIILSILLITGKLGFLPRILQIPFVILGCIVGTIAISFLLFGKQNTKKL